MGPGGKYVVTVDSDPDVAQFFDSLKSNGTRVPSTSGAAQSAKATLFISTMTGYVNQQHLPKKVTDPDHFRGSGVDISLICDYLNHIAQDQYGTKKACHTCSQLGHFAENCPQNAQAARAVKLGVSWPQFLRPLRLLNRLQPRFSARVPHCWSLAGVWLQ